MGLDVVTKASVATWVAVLTGVACGGGERRMQEPDALVLTGNAGAELGAFTSPRGFVALSDSLLLVSDGRERRLAVLDMKSRTPRDVGTRGHGPREFEFPGHAVRYLRGAALWDRGNGRILILDSLGEPIHTVVPPQGLPLTELGGGDARSRV